jgi:imidazolonepropionase-like amidohydrolase
MPNAGMPGTVVVLATWALLAFGISHPGLTASGRQKHQKQTSRNLRLLLLGHDIGTERSTIERSAPTSTLTSHFEYKDRGLTVALDATLTYRDDSSPVSYKAHGKSYRYFSVDSTVDSITETRPAFPIDGMAPLAVQELLIRYWLSHGRPATVIALPSGDPLQITELPASAAARGIDTSWRHFVVQGVIWGREHVWLDRTDLHLRGITTTAGVLPFEAIDGDVPAQTGAQLAPMFSALAAMSDFGSSGPDARPQPAQQDTFALVGGRLIDGTGAAPVEDATVFVRHGRIVAAGPRTSVTLPPGVASVDVRGKSVMPGLWDMHAHVGQPEWGPAYLAEGVTTIRDMGGAMGTLLALRDAWSPRSQLRGIGPRLLTAGLIDGPGPDAFGSVTAATPDEGRRAVSTYREYSFNEIKLYNLLDRPTTKAIIESAHANGMKVTGHIPNGLTLRDVVDMGIDQVAHLVVRDAPGTPQFTETAAMLKQHGTVMDPTISWNELLGRSAQTPIESFQPGITRVPPQLRRLLEGANGGDVTPEQARARLDRQLAIVKGLYDAGVPFVAGTDKGVPGASVQREIELYVQAGLPPIDAIRAATAIPARVMGLDHDTGTIAPGLRADLIVVDGNPLARISDLRRVTMVATAGRLYETAPLWRAAGFAQ